jgi:hypothetical protein
MGKTGQLTVKRTKTYLVVDENLECVVRVDNQSVQMGSLVLEGFFDSVLGLLGMFLLEGTV